MDKEEIVRIILDEAQRIKRTDKALLASKVNVHNVADRIVKACGISPVSGNEVALPSLTRVGAYLEQHFDESQDPFYQSQVTKYYTVSPHHIKTLIDKLLEGNDR